MEIDVGFAGAGDAVEEAGRGGYFLEGVEGGELGGGEGHGARIVILRGASGRPVATGGRR